MLLRRKENRKREGGEWRRWIRPAGLGLVFILGALVVYSAWPYAASAGRDFTRYVANHPYFRIREIQVRDGLKVDGGEIVKMAGLRHGTNIWRVDLRAIEERLRKHPWVRRAQARRELPHRIVVEVEERESKAIIVVGGLYYVDADGTVFKAVGPGEKTDFPLLSGVRRSELAASGPALRGRLREAIRVSDIMEKRGLAVSEVRFLSHGVVLYPVAHPVALHMGWGDWEEKLDRLERVLKMWRGREGSLAALDLNFAGQVVARTKAG